MPLVRWRTEPEKANLFSQVLHLISCVRQISLEHPRFPGKQAEEILRSYADTGSTGFELMRTG